MAGKTKVMVIDDSALVRQVVGQILEADPSLEVIDGAADPVFAMRKMQKVWPDVIVLDIEMPRMDGITFLQKLMKERPTPVVICSALTEDGASVTMKALAEGAVDIITKPKLKVRDFLTTEARMLTNTIKAAAQARVRKIADKNGTARPKTPAQGRLTADAILSRNKASRSLKTSEKVIALGASTGGTHAFEYIFPRLTEDCHGVVAAIHMPEGFTAAFAKRLNTMCQVEVREAEDGDLVEEGKVLIAHGARHLMVRRRSNTYYVQVKDGPLVNRHKPSVDVLFRSVAEAAGRNGLGVLMTGMGDDGAQGLLEMLEAGSETIAQDEESSVVFGMPAEAIKRGAAQRILSLSGIPGAMLAYAQDPVAAK